MKKQGLTPKLGRVALACILSTSLVTPMATPAIADTIEDLRKEEEEARAAASAAQQRAESARTQQSALEVAVQEAQTRLAQLSQEAEVAEYDLISITNELEATKEHIGELDVQIDETRADLDVSKGELSKIVADTYKNGRPTLLSVALNASSFDDLISRIKYANKVAEYEASVVHKVKDLEAQLEHLPLVLPRVCEDGVSGDDGHPQLLLSALRGDLYAAFVAEAKELLPVGRRKLRAAGRSLREVVHGQREAQVRALELQRRAVR